MKRGTSWRPRKQPHRTHSDSVTTTVTGVAVETATMAGSAMRDKAIEHGVDHAIAEMRDRAHERRENAEEHTDPDASPEPLAP